MKITLESAFIKQILKPFDIVTDEKGNVGIVQEVSIIDNFPHTYPIRESYAVNWIVGSGVKFAWYDRNELTKVCNLFVKIAEMSCHPHGQNKEYVKQIIRLG